MATTHLLAHVQRRQFTVDEYKRIAEAGILHEGDRLVVLIDGEIVSKAEIGTPHGGGELA